MKNFEIERDNGVALSFTGEEKSDYVPMSQTEYMKLRKEISSIEKQIVLSDAGIKTLNDFNQDIDNKAIVLFLQVLAGEFHKWQDTIENDREVACAMTELIDIAGMLRQGMVRKKKLALE